MLTSQTIRENNKKQKSSNELITQQQYGSTNNQPHIDDGLVELAEALEEIDENSPLAKLNAISISDNNGGRIYL